MNIVVISKINRELTNELIHSLWTEFYQEWSHLTDQGTCSNQNDITAELLPVRYQGK